MRIDCKLMDDAEVLRMEPMLCPDDTAALHNPASYHIRWKEELQGCKYSIL